MQRIDQQQALKTILRNPAIWRAEPAQPTRQSIATAYPALDQALPERGWPVGMLTELLVSETGVGELALLTPALRAICAQGRGIALIAPPYLPHARAWEAAGITLERMLIVDSEGSDLLWAAEQALRSGECGAVVVWSQAAGRALNNRALQRLQLAVGTANALCFLYRPVSAEANPSPAPLRIRLAAQAGALQVHLVKCRGALRARPLRVQPFPAHWAQVGTATEAPRPAGSQRDVVTVRAPAEWVPLAESKRSTAPGHTPALALHRQVRPAQLLSRSAVLAVAAPDTSLPVHTHSV